MAIVCSPRVKKYFDSIEKEVEKLYDVASKARAKNLDPEPRVDIPLAASVAGRVEALVSSVKPEIMGSGVAERIVEVEKKYGIGDWRVSLIIGEEIALGKFCEFKDKREAIEVGSRAGLAYITLGVVAAPLEGLVEVKLKKRRDGDDYCSVFFAGPIRAAGGTAQAVSCLIVDYVRRKVGIGDYDPTEEEVKRYQVEVDDYCHRVVHRQYVPTAEEIGLLINSLKIEINGDPTEKLEVSQHKRLDRVETTVIRGGLCLVLTEGLPLKANKVWKNLQKWKDEFGLEDWVWVKEFITLKDKLHSAPKDDEENDSKVQSIDTYLSDMVAGRPVFGYPLRSGGFRLRYGRARTSGFAATCIHPATMIILKNYIATGTQVKTERPGKATVFSPCYSMDGPIVKLKDGSVLKLNEELAKEYKFQVDEIIYLGDILVNYGDFVENGKNLVPSGYVEEWWEQELEKAGGAVKEPESFDEALKLSEEYKIPLHPKYIFYWKEINSEQFLELVNWFKKLKDNKLPLEESPKRALELIGCPHKVQETNVIFDKAELEILNFFLVDSAKGENGLECVNSLNKVIVRDKAGTFIGTRMGRPEKAKIRKMKGSPVGLFPVGEEGGRLRNLTEAMKVGYVTGDFPLRLCSKCGRETIYNVCECGAKADVVRICPMCKKKSNKERCHTDTRSYMNQKLDINRYVDLARKQAKIDQLPPIIKGIRGTSNKNHVPENLAKSFLRAKHNLYVNKDGTVRYDMTEMTVTHFRPKEANISVEKLKELGYDVDINGKELVDENQMLQLYPQDVILPSCPDAADDGADKELIKICNFVDDLLENFYGLEPYYNVKTRDDLIGHVVIGLAPHTSGGTAGRIIGFSKTQGCFAHPYWHAAQRRNCDGDETCVILALDAFLNFSRQYLPDRRGSRSMDAPLVLTTLLDPTELDTEVFNLDVVDKYPLELYEAAEECKYPWDVKIKQVRDLLGTEDQFEGVKYTHEVRDFNSGVLYSAYKSIPTMVEKLQGQVELANILRAVDHMGVATLVIEKHFIRDVKGNLRKFTIQGFRCINCNEKYRRPPLAGTCVKCKNPKLVFTIAEGTVKKYLEISLKLAETAKVDPYLLQSLEIVKRRIEGVFGKDKTKQIELEGFFG